jgi:hypothetical protein
MSTAISTNAKTVDYPALAADSRQAKIITANLDGEPMARQDLVKVPTPAGGGTTWSIDSNGNIENTDEIVGLLVAIGKEGILWPKDDPSEMRPVIQSSDLLVGYRVSDDLGDVDPKALEKYRIGDRRYDWAAIAESPEFGWGSGKGGGRSRRVKETRVLAILRQGDTWPVLVTVGAGSLANFLPWSRRLPDYHYACVVGLKLQKVKNAGGQPYSQIVPRLVGTITPEQAEVARVTYTEPLRRMFNAPPSGATVVVDAHEDE